MNNYNNTTANTQGHELGWGDEIQQESSFILLPEGDYRFTVEKFDRARHAGSANIPPCNKAIVHFRVFSPDGSSVLLQENLFLHTKMEWKLSEFFASIGMKHKGQAAQMNWSQVCGKSGVCHVKIRTYEKRDGGGTGQANQIDKLYPSYDQPQTAQNAPQQPYNAPQQPYSQNNPQSWQQPQNGTQNGWNRGQF